MLTEGEQLLRGQGAAGRLAHDEQGLGLLALQLEHVAGELMHLREGDADDGLAALLEQSFERGALVGVADGVETDDGRGRADVHHHVGVVDGRALLV